MEWKVYCQRVLYCQTLNLPISILQINTDLDPKCLLKQQYTQKIRQIAFSNQVNQKIRQKRIEINTAYEELAQFFYNNSYSEQEKELIDAVIQENISQLQEILTKSPNYINYRFKGSNYPLIYFAVRTGCFQTVELILKMGCSIDFRNDLSTPMHCAAYYGHYQIIGLLLQYGVPINIRNINGQLPLDEFSSVQISKLLYNAEKDNILQLITELIEENLCHSTMNFYQNEKIVAKKIILHNSKLKFDDHEDAFHGTSFHNFKSIAKHSLKKPGELVDGLQIKIVDGHIKNNMKWAKAVFVSPSLLYAANPVYAKQIINKTNNNTQIWLPVVQVKVKKGSYETQRSTVRSYVYKKGEPQQVEYRIEMNTQECRKKVIVVALLLIEKKYMESFKDYQQIEDSFLKKQQ